MGRSRIGWALGVIAPWCVAAALVLSFSADAGQDATFGASRAALVGLPVPQPANLIPISDPAMPGAFGLEGLQRHDPVRLASLVLGQPSDFTQVPDEIQPKRQLKPHAKVFPEPDNSHRSDPFIGLRPTFDSQLRQPGSLALYRANRLALSSKDYLAFDGFGPARGPVPGPDSVSTFDNGDDATSGATAAEGEATGPGASPGQSGSAPTLTSSTPSTFDGATPSVKRAIALGSTTPAPADAVPVEVAAVPVAPSAGGRPTGANMSVVGRTSRPDYAALIDQDQASREEHCLAEAIYFEARSEPIEGQAAVAQVVLNRVRSGLYPSTVCGVVFQNRHRHNACQFSFACDGHALRITEPEAWATARRIAKQVTDGETYVAVIGDATHYHANYVRPRWARSLKRVDRIGHHIFYELKPGQT